MFLYDYYLSYSTIGINICNWTRTVCYYSISTQVFLRFNSVTRCARTMQGHLYFPKIDSDPGNPTSKPTIVFLAGFPDDQLSPWGSILRSKLTEDYHCVFLCLPGYEKGGVPKRWGYTFDELFVIMHHTILQSTKEGEQIYLVGHDWGSYIAHKYQNKYPNTVKKLTLLDIGMFKLWTATATQLLFISLYQGWFAFSYLLSQVFSKAVGRFFFLLFVNFVSPLFTGLWSSGDVGERLTRDDDVVLRCYPYFYLWSQLLTNTIVYPRFPSCPLLYIVSVFLPCLNIFYMISQGCLIVRK